MTDIQAVSLKLPPFWNTSPEAWFCHVEAQFNIRNITTDETKYFYVVAALDTDAANRCLSLLSTPPNSGKFQALKAFLLSAFKLSDTERAAVLFNLKGLGDSKPSELMDRMLALLTPHEPCFLFRHLFVQQLPDFVRIPLASCTEQDCRKLAAQADQLYLSGTLRPQPVGQPIAQVESLPAQPVHAVTARKSIAQALCFYHQRFGDKAKRCEPHCSRYSSSTSTRSGNAQAGRR